MKLHENFEQFAWENEVEYQLQGNRISFKAIDNSDYFNVEENSQITKNYSTAFLSTKVKGDFIAKVKVSGDFVTTYDSAVLMVKENNDKWAKACMEKTDFGTIAVVTVVTDGLSDDANGCNIDKDSVWLKVVRVGNNFSFHYSFDDTTYNMLRFFNLKLQEEVQVGITAQAPAGKGQTFSFEDFTVENKKAVNMRKGE